MENPTRIPRHIHLQRRSFPEEGRHKHKLATPTFWASQSPGFKNNRQKCTFKNYLQGNEGQQREHDTASDKQADDGCLHATPDGRDVGHNH